MSRNSVICDAPWVLDKRLSEIDDYVDAAPEAARGRLHPLPLDVVAVIARALGARAAVKSTP